MMNCLQFETGSVADPDPGSGAIFDPWIPDIIKSRSRIRDPGSGMNIPDLIFENQSSVF
jgi:hypothetical protein